jgi:hypothetical protein
VLRVRRRAEQWRDEGRVRRVRELGHHDQ